MVNFKMRIENLIDRLILPIRKSRILWRFVILYGVICIVPVLLMAGFYRSYYISQMQKKLGSDSAKILTMVAQRQNFILDNVKHAAEQVAISEPVQQLLSDPENPIYKKYQLLTKLNSLLAQTQTSAPFFKSAWVVDEDGTIVCNLGYHQIDENTLHDLVQQAEKQYPRTFITALQQIDMNRPSLVLVKAVNRNDFTNHRLGYLVLALSEKSFPAETYSSLYPEEQGQMLFVGNDGIVVSSQNGAFPVGQPISDPYFAEQIRAHSHSTRFDFSMQIANESYFIVSSYNPGLQWSSILLLKESYITEELTDLNRLILFVSLLFIILGFLILLFLAASIVRPTDRLVRYCQDVANRSGPRSIDDSAHDEIGYLTRSISNMVQVIDAYHTKEVENNIERKNLEIQMLQAQINPHFLFNILNSIKWVAVLSRVPAVADSLSALSGLLKNTILNKQEFISLQEEIENLKNYALIQSLRYTDRFTMEYQVETGIMHLPILKFLLQPIVENSIIYGVENVDHLVTIRISAKHLDGGLQIIISDDGAGFDTKLLQQPNRSSKRFSGIGVSNVAQRIRLVYGDNASMQVESTPGHGTTVSMFLPDQEEEKDV